MQRFLIVNPSSGTDSPTADELRDAAQSRGVDVRFLEDGDDLSETWIEDWAAVGLSEIEALLAKHAAFLGYLEEAVDES